MKKRKTSAYDRVLKLGEIDVLEDGFKYYFPRRGGALSAKQLREIADGLDRANENHQKGIDGYFSRNKFIKLGEYCITQDEGEKLYKQVSSLLNEPGVKIEIDFTGSVCAVPFLNASIMRFYREHSMHKLSRFLRIVGLDDKLHLVIKRLGRSLRADPKLEGIINKVIGKQMKEDCL